MSDSRCASSNLAVASTPLAPNRCRVVFGSEEKENIPQSYRMGRVVVFEGENHREGASAGEPFSTFMLGINADTNRQLGVINQQLAALGETNALQNQQLAAQNQQLAAQNQQLAALGETNALQNQQLAALGETNALQNQRIAVHDATIAHLTDRSNEYAGLLDDAARTHNELQDTITEIRQRNADLTIDRGWIDVLVRAHAFAMCPLCSERYRAVICLPCMHTFCSNCCTDDQSFCQLCFVDIEFRYDLP
jgi:hypothetical protein